MLSKIKLSALAVATATLIGISSSGASASIVCSFGSAGGIASGTDCLGHGWQYLDNGTNGHTVWGIPGNQANVTPFLGIGAEDFHITFDLPDGIEIDQTGGPSGASGITRFEGLPDDIWSVQFMDMIGPVGIDTVWFFAPPNTPLLNGDTFFVNVAFTDQIAPVAFEASWTVPEPAALALFGLGLAGLGATRRRRQAA